MKTLDLIREQEKYQCESFCTNISCNNSYRSSIIAIFEEEIRRLEENRRYTHNSVSIESTPYPVGWNDCLDQQIAYYQEIIEELKK